MSVVRAVVVALSTLPLGCGEGGTATGPGGRPEAGQGLICTVPRAELAFTLVPDAILSLSDPPFVPSSHPDAAYVRDSDRVVGLLLEDEPVALPLNVLRFHEIVNLDRPDVSLAVTFCPLTGSSIVFDRAAIGGLELGVSGILRHNNLVMFDRADEPSFFSQMGLGAPLCGPAVGSVGALRVVPSLELRWGAWKRLYPHTEVLSERTGGGGSYRVNPHVEYERIDNAFLLVPFDVDTRRPPKERVLGIAAGADGGPAFPFGELDRAARQAVPALNGSAVVFWDRAAQGAAAFSSELDGQRLSFAVTERGFTDTGTGSEWRLDGLAVSGPLAGRRLAPIADAYVAFWFAWAAFQPETYLWDGRAR